MDFHNTVVTKSPEETKKVGQKLSDSILKKQKKGELTGPVIICLYGELGSGKTTFVQGVLQGLGITSRILSPTFIIVRRYECPQLDRSISHVDCYRLTDTDKIDTFGFQEIFSDPSGLVLVEWADRLGTLLPDDRIDIYFDVDTEGHMLKVTKDSYGCTE